MEGASRIPGFYPETPAPVSRYNPINGTNANNSPNTSLGSIGHAGGPIRRTPASAINRSRAHSTPYARPVPQNTPGSGGRGTRRDEDDDEVCFINWDLLMDRRGLRRGSERRRQSWWGVWLVVSRIGFLVQNRRGKR
jgi:hypothetical protein